MHSSDSSGPTPGRLHISLSVDGQRADIAEMSRTHAVLHCDAALRPDQRVRVTFRTGDSVLRTSARVSSARLQMTGEGARYRVELAFDGDTAAIEELLS